MWAGIDFSRRAGLGHSTMKWIPPLASHPARVPATRSCCRTNGAQHPGCARGVPHQEIVAMVVTHGESFGLSRNCTERYMKTIGRSIGRTLHYAYNVLQRLDDFVARTPRPKLRAPSEARRILTDEICDRRRRRRRADHWATVSARGGPQHVVHRRGPQRRCRASTPPRCRSPPACSRRSSGRCVIRTKGSASPKICRTAQILDVAPGPTWAR